MASIILWSIPGFCAEIVIGFTGPLSGPAAEYGQDCVNGIDMAIKEINAAGGVAADGQKFTFRLERMDDKVSPELAVANARQLVEKGALAVFDPVFSSAAALLKINEEECSEFLVMGYTSSPKADISKNNLLIIAAPMIPDYAKVYVNFAWEKGWRKAAMVVTQGAYGDEWRQIFRTAWEKKGGRITADKPANFYTRTDFVAPLTAAIATNRMSFSSVALPEQQLSQSPRPAKWVSRAVFLSLTRPKWIPLPKCSTEQNLWRMPSVRPILKISRFR